MTEEEPEPVGDFGQSHAWPEGLWNHLDRFRQGHIVDDVPIFFANLGGTELWRPSRQIAVPEDRGIAIERDANMHRAMLLTQGCDIVRLHTPWVTVVPVYDAAARLEKPKQGNVRAGNIGYLVPLTAEWAEGGLWVADLRLELAVEKSALYDRQPVDAFAAEADYTRLADLLGTRRKRPAVPDPVLEHIVKPLYAALKARPDAGADLTEGVRELRVQLDHGLTPTRVSLFVVAKDGAEPNDAAWTDLLADIYREAQENNLRLLGPEVMTLDAMTAAEYLTSHRIEDAESS